MDLTVLCIHSFVSSWLGTRLWNQASRLLPTSLTGQLIVFETLAALAFGYAWRGDWPAPTAALGICLLIAGVAIGANALCLPGDILVVTDALVQLASEEELLAVLAHEAGHARHRHPLQMMVRGHALTLATGLIGGQDNPIQGVAEGLVGNAYSRAFEHQADREALAVLRRLNLTPAPFFSILDKLERQQGKTDVPSFLLTHPSNRERQSRAAGT
jgi:Zn-dependent protease with chaperone function